MKPLNAAIVVGLVLWVGCERRTEKLSDSEVTARFAKLYEATRPYMHVRFLGVPTMQYPNDLIAYQEIIAETRPEVIIETGTAAGGSALFFASIAELLGTDTKVVTIDLKLPSEMSEALAGGNPVTDATEHSIWKKRVTFIRGSSTDAAVVAQVAELARGKRTMVTLDSLHRREHVAAELEAYAPMVSAGGYLIVQDTRFADGNAKPEEAVQAFLKRHPEFQIDATREKHLLTQNPGGFLRRATE